MIPKLRELKEQPLLNLPRAKAGPLDVRNTDWRIIEAGLESALNLDDAFGKGEFAELAYYSHMLGRTPTISATARKKVVEYLDDLRKPDTKNGKVQGDREFILGKSVYMLGEMGEKGFQKPADIGRMEYMLLMARNRDPCSMFTAELIFILGEFGRKVEVTAEDRGNMDRWLDTFRNKHPKPLSLMEQVFYRRKIGFDDRLTKREETHVIEELERLRERRDPDMARVLYMMNGMVGRDSETYKQPAMPPLKMFRGRRR